MSDRSYLYVATGPDYRREAFQAVQSLRRHSRLQILLASDKAMHASPFDRTIILDRPALSFSDKIAGMKMAGAEKCVYLDTDTFVCGPTDCLFDLLDRFDIAAAHASWRFSPLMEGQKIAVQYYRSDDAPECFPDFNTGVIAFRKSPRTLAFFDRWESIHANYMRCGKRPANDQAAFREAVWSTDGLAIYVLPPEFNYRADFPGAVGGVVRILHGRKHCLEGMAQQINEALGARAFLPLEGRLVSCPQFAPELPAHKG